MKRFIKALEDKGIMESIVTSAIVTEKITGNPVTQGGLEMILDFHMSMDENLEDIFLQEAHAIAMKSVFKHVWKQIVERQKAEAMNNVDVDSLFAKATGRTPSKAVVEKEMNIEESIVNALSEAMGEAFKEILRESMK